MIYAPIDIEFLENYKWRKASHLAKGRGYAIPAYTFALIYLQYIFASKKARRPIDVRTNKVDSFLFHDIGIIKDKDLFNDEKLDIEIVNSIFQDLGLLTKKFTLSKEIYYKYNAKDIAKSQSKSQKTQSDFDDSQSETQSNRKVYQTPEYYKLQRLKAKLKKGTITQVESGEMQYLNEVIECQKNTQTPSNPQSSQKTQSENAKSQSSENHPPIVRDKAIERDILNKEINKENSEPSKIEGYSLEFEEFYQTFEQSQNKQVKSKRKDMVCAKWKIAVKNKDSAAVLASVNSYLQYLKLATWRQKQDVIAWLNQAKYEVDWELEAQKESNKTNVQPILSPYDDISKNGANSEGIVKINFHHQPDWAKKAILREEKYASNSA